jgi:hypothetical protein
MTTMNPDFLELERAWITAVQRRDTEALDQLLDQRFVCTSWSSDGALTSRAEYLGGIDSAAFGCCNVVVDSVQSFADTAVVRCRLKCECMIDSRTWNATFLVTDVWSRRGLLWKAVSRHASVPLSEWSSFESHQTDTGERRRRRAKHFTPHHRAESA